MSFLRKHNHRSSGSKPKTSALAKLRKANGYPFTKTEARNLIKNVRQACPDETLSCRQALNMTEFRI